MKYEESEKARENLSIQNASLFERNGVLEQAEEATRRNMARLERRFEELRAEISNERARRERAESDAQSNAHAMHDAVAKGDMQQALAEQAETQYKVLVTSRSHENERNQAAVDQMQFSLRDLLQQRDTEAARIRRLEVIAEQKDREIIQLVEINRKLGGNFEAYKKERDASTNDLAKQVSEHGEAVEDALQKAANTLGEMKWVVNVKQNLRLGNEDHSEEKRSQGR